MADVGTLGAGIGFGAMVGMVAAAATHAIYTATRRAHAGDASLASSSAAAMQSELEKATLDKMQVVGLADGASILAKLMEARDSIHQYSERSDVSSERTAPTMNLASAIVKASLLRAEEMADLKMRMDDPLLDKPADAASRMEACQEDLIRAYRAVADSRTRVLLRKEWTADDLLQETRNVTDGGLGQLTHQLEEETQIQRGVERRMLQQPATGLQARNSLGGADADSQAGQCE